MNNVTPIVRSCAFNTDIIVRVIRPEVRPLGAPDAPKRESTFPKRVADARTHERACVRARVPRVPAERSAMCNDLHTKHVSRRRRRRRRY